MTKLLYGNNLQKSCGICSYGGGISDDGKVYCTKHKKQGKPREKSPDDLCRGFCYDPLLRKPVPVPESESFSEEDFKL